MYYPQAPKEPSGCLQTLVITRVLFAILLVPIALMIAAVSLVVLLVIALSVHPALGLIPFGIGGAIIYGLVRWDKKRVDSLPKDDDY
jgi:hypothetical protein